MQRAQNRHPAARACARSFDDVVGQSTCPLDLELKWMTEVSSSVYATPLITDLYADGRKDVVVPAYVHALEVRSAPPPPPPAARRSHSPPAAMQGDGSRAVLACLPAPCRSLGGRA